MANLLAHALFALALFSVPASLLQGAPLTGYAFVAALTALLPDLEVDPRAARKTPYGHSLAYGLLWALLVLCALSLLVWSGVLPSDSWPWFQGACLTGLGSHLLLDALTHSGILTRPRAGGSWGTFTPREHARTSSSDFFVSALSLGTILTLLVLY